jgi:hypothetical protein
MAEPRQCERWAAAAEVRGSVCRREVALARIEGFPDGGRPKVGGEVVGRWGAASAACRRQVGLEGAEDREDGEGRGVTRSGDGIVGEAEDGQKLEDGCGSRAPPTA